MKKICTIEMRKYLKNPELKRDYNKELFSIVAPEYDFVTRALSLGFDPLWKKGLIRRLPALEKPVCLDLAAGTGDFSFALAQKYPKGSITGLDLTPEMVHIAECRNVYKNVNFVTGDMCNTACADQSIDIITGGYALRNAPDLAQLLSELHRILKPGGTAAFLEFVRPKNNMIRIIESAILKVWGGLWGLLLHSDVRVYGYIAESLKCFPTSDVLHQMIRDAGFNKIRSTRYGLGFIEVVVFEKCR